MIQQIEQTKTFQSLEPMSKQLAIKRVNRLQIEDAIIQARTMGVEAWSAQTGLQERWKNIVKEVIANEQI